MTYSENLSITLGAVASSGLPVTYSLVSGANGTLNNNVLSISDTGQIVIEATQIGNNSYNPAIPIRSINQWSSANFTGDFPDQIKHYWMMILIYSPTSNRGGTIYYTSSNPQAAIVSGTFVKILGIGDVTITASQPANSKYR